MRMPVVVSVGDEFVTIVEGENIELTCIGIGNQILQTAWIKVNIVYIYNGA